MISEMPMLLIVEGQTPGQRILVDQPELLIGRDEDCDLVIPERQVSRHHARLTHVGDRYMLADLRLEKRYLCQWTAIGRTLFSAGWG